MPEIKIPAEEVFPVLKENILVDGFHVVIDLERSHGSVIVDALHGNEYLDCYGYFATLPLGHNHPKMKDEGFRRSLMTAALANPANSDIYSQEFAAFVKIFRTLAVPDDFRYLFFVAGGALAELPKVFDGQRFQEVLAVEAFVKITCRLVPNQRAEEITSLVKDVIENRCPPQVRAEVKVLGGGDPYVVIPPGKPGSIGGESALLKKAFASAEAHIEEVFGASPIYLREGGSIPIIGDLKEVAGMDSLLIGLFTNADNLHAPNESFHLGIMEKAISAFEKLFTDIASG